MKRFLAGAVMAAVVAMVIKWYNNLGDAKPAFVVAFSTIGVSLAEISKWLPENIGTISAFVGLCLACLTSYKVILEIMLLRRKVESEE